MSPERHQQALGELLARARTRARALRVLRSAAGAATLAAIIYAFAGSALTPTSAMTGTVLVLAIACVTSAIWPRVTSVELARAIERATPESRNVILTATELAATDRPTAEAVTTRVFADAQRIAARVDLARVFPAARTVGFLAAAFAIAATSVVFRPGVWAAGSTSVDPDAANLAQLLIEVFPPDYTGLPAARLREPQRIEVFTGSRVRVLVTAAASRVRLETVAGATLMTSANAGDFQAEMIADADGFLAIVPVNARGTAGARRLVGITVTPDRVPQVRVNAPGRDLRVADGGRTLSIAVSAEDDLGLAGLRLRYTRVSGSGENFTFKEGDVPLALTKATGTAWSGATRWALASMGLEPGDMLIYRAVATDNRPGAPAAESDAFIVEIAAAGAASADGFAIDDREDRYAISQQMVIVKTERLLGRRATMPAAEFASGALDLAAEQRQVRAEFVFMMGGELADAGLDLNSLSEEHEAEGEDDLAAGRLVNQGRMDIMRAIRSMSRAAARLADGDATSALPFEKEALNYLQRAFSKSRYILRTLGSRERLDLSRRLTGLLAALGSDVRPAAEAPPNPRLTTLRSLLADVASLPIDAAAAKDSAAKLGALAQRALQTDPASAPVREAAATLTALAAALGSGGDAGAARQMKDDAVAAIAGLVRLELPPGNGPSMPGRLADLAGALGDALRNKERRR